MSKLHFHKNLPLFSAFTAEMLIEEGQGCPEIPQNVTLLGYAGCEAGGR